MMLFTMDIFIIAILFAVSLILAVRSMKDIHIPKEIQQLISNKKYKGRIVFFKGKKTKHYSSSSSSFKSSV